MSPRRVALPLLFATAAISTVACRNWDFYDRRLGTTTGGDAVGAAGPTGATGTGGAATTSGSPSSSMSGATTASVTGTTKSVAATTVSTSATVSTTTTASATSSATSTSGSTSASSSSSGNPTHCGGPSNLADDFAGTPDPAWVWSTDKWGNGAVAEMNNALVVTLPSAQASGAFGAFTSHRYYDMTGDSISVEVVNAGNTTTTERAFFGLGNDDSTHPHVSFEQQAGSLGVFMSTGNGSYSILSASTYDPLKHRYWRIRNTGGTTYFETSPDANTWSIFWQGSIATVFPTNIAKIELGGATNGGELNPSPIQFAKLNGGGPPTGMWCPISSITDDFQSTTRSPIWARSWTGVSETVTQGNGTLTFTLAPNVATGAMYESYQSYDLTSNAVLVHVPMVPNTTATHAEIRLGLVAQGSNEIQIGEASGYMIFRYIKAGTYSDTSQPYDAVAHAWWRIRESGGTIYWETAPDGKTWSGRRVVTLTTLGFPITGMDVELSGDTYSPDANPGTCSCSAFNLPPP